MPGETRDISTESTRGQEDLQHLGGRRVLMAA